MMSSNDVGYDAFARNRVPSDAASFIIKMIEMDAQALLEHHGFLNATEISPDAHHEARCALSTLGHARDFRAAQSGGQITEAILAAMLMVASAGDMYSDRLRRLAELGLQQGEQLSRGRLKDYESRTDRTRLWEQWKRDFDRMRAADPQPSVMAVCKNIAKQSAKVGKRNRKGKPFSWRTVKRAVDSLSDSRRPSVT